jgi:hypothetical protein
MAYRQTAWMLPIGGIGRRKSYKHLTHLSAASAAEQYRQGEEYPHEADDQGKNGRDAPIKHASQFSIREATKPPKLLHPVTSKVIAHVQETEGHQPNAYKNGEKVF